MKLLGNPTGKLICIFPTNFAFTFESSSKINSMAIFDISKCIPNFNKSVSRERPKRAHPFSNLFITPFFFSCKGANLIVCSTIFYFCTLTFISIGIIWTFLSLSLSLSVCSKFRALCRDMSICLFVLFISLFAD